MYGKPNSYQTWRVDRFTALVPRVREDPVVFEQPLPILFTKSSLKLSPLYTEPGPCSLVELLERLILPVLPRPSIYPVQEEVYQ